MNRVAALAYQQPARQSAIVSIKYCPIEDAGFERHSVEANLEVAMSSIISPGRQAVEASNSRASVVPEDTVHAGWVRVCHWIIVLSVLVLFVTGSAMLMTHPRLYWGEVGNDLTPALIELPISRNHRHGGWTPGVPFSDGSDAPVSASRTYSILNLNSWGRSLHFLAAWFLVITGLAYLLAGIFSGHLGRHILPRAGELKPGPIKRDIRDHLRFQINSASGGPPYGILQKISYFLVILVFLPFMFLTGLTMSPTVTAAFPVLLDVFGGFQSARTLHFFVFVALFLFFVVHVFMVVLSGFRAQMRGMVLGKRK
jgi:thiosulfate reductase cytochrome b subunit